MGDNIADGCYALVLFCIGLALALFGLAGLIGIW